MTVRLSTGELRDGGYLQEANRRFFHPLGLALEVTVAEEPTTLIALSDEGVAALRALAENGRAAGLISASQGADLAARIDEAPRHVAGSGWLSGVWDCRHDPEGMRFGEGIIDPAKVRAVDREWAERERLRVPRLGWMTQPVEP